MNRSGKTGITNERRTARQRRLDDERRQVDEGAPERRLGLERRKQAMGPPERRVRNERRDCENGPPAGWRDRRRSAERRSPDVVESSFEEWVKLRAIRCTTGAEKDHPTDDHDRLGRIIIRD
ncbi:MAG: hypothetical protein WC023_03975 [Rhodocyclaceae bacterium]